MLGVSAQKTMLGTFTVSGKTKAICACRDFTADGSRLFGFCPIKNTILDSDSNGSGTELADILDTIEKQQYVAPDTLKEHFWDMFIIDALLGNFDRHAVVRKFRTTAAGGKSYNTFGLLAVVCSLPPRPLRLCRSTGVAFAVDQMMVRL